MLAFGALPAGIELPRVEKADWSMAWETELLESCRTLKENAEAFVPVTERFLTAVGLSPSVELSIDRLGKLHWLAQLLVKHAGRDLSCLFHKQFSRFPEAITDLRGLKGRYEAAVASLRGSYASDQFDVIPLEDLDRQWREAVASFWPMSWFGKRKITRLLQTYALTGNVDPNIDLPLIREIRIIRAQSESSSLATLSGRWKGLETDVDSLEATVAAAMEMRTAILEIGQPLQATDAITRTIGPVLRAVQGTHPVHSAAMEYLRGSKTFTESWSRYQKAAGATPAVKDSRDVVREAAEQADLVLGHRTLLNKWTVWIKARRGAEKLGLGSFVEAIRSRGLALEVVRPRFELAYARWWLPIVLDQSDSLRAFQRARHEAAIEDFRQLDDQARVAAAPRVREAILHGLPLPDQVPRRSELGLLRHQMGLKRPSRSIREMIAGMPESFSRLAPCLLMSPLSIAQYLPADQAPFDVVVFDEASQIATWDAIGAVARGKQTIIVGDPKQLPPTNFFGRVESDEDDDSVEDHDKDLESILDEAKASGLPTLQLNWHYRSRHESLIVFSNQHYYGNELITFPAAESVDRGVSLRIVEGGCTIAGGAGPIAEKPKRSLQMPSRR